MTKTNSPLVIGRDEVRELLDWPSIYEATKSGLIMGGGPDKSSSVSAQVMYQGGSLHLKAAALKSEKVISVKSNLRPNQGGVSGILLAYDLATERLAGIIDAGFMTAARTGAIAAIAAERMAPAHPVTVAILGIGPVGVESAAALLHVLDVKHLQLWSNSGSRMDEVSGNLAHHVKVTAYRTVLEAIADADVVVTATPSSAPILTAEGLLRGAIILAMGADTVGKRELAADVLGDADVVADVPSDATRVGESAYLPIERMSDVISLSDVLVSSGQIPRNFSHLVFDSVGSSHVDAAITSVIMTRAREKGVGRPLHS